MATRKKVKVTEAAKKIILRALKGFGTIINKYLPEGKDKKEIVAKYEELAALVEKAVG